MSEIIGNRYQITNLIGKGGMADVYLALDTILNREVAVKVLKSDMSSDPVALERFNREALASTQLSHPNIVDVYDVGDEGNKHYIVMEYVKGSTLKALIRKRGPIPFKESVWIMKQLAGALMEAHRNGIIHRDVKTQNVLVKADGTIKIADFGIALANGAMQITSKDSVLGSVHYLAPELSKGAQATMQSDIYSLGIVFYEMLTGDIPYKGDTAVQVALQHIKGEIPSVRKLNPAIPQSVENILIKATAKSIENRYKNAALLLRDLNECLKPEHLNDEKVNLNEELEVKTAKTIHISEKEIAKQKEKNKPKKNDDGESLFLTIFLVCVSILSAFILVAILYLTGNIGKKTTDLQMPDITELNVQEANDLLVYYGLDLDTSSIEWVMTDNTPQGQIISQSPEPGIEVEAGTRIKIVVSDGIYEKIEDYSGLNYLEAARILKTLGFNVNYEAVESDLDSGKVVSQSIEPGSKYNPNEANTITLKYSEYTKMEIPYEMKGWDIEKAMAFFEEEGINYELSKQAKTYFSSNEIEDIDKDEVVLTDPMFGQEYTQEAESKVIIYYYEEDN